MILWSYLLFLLVSTYSVTCQRQNGTSGTEDEKPVKLYQDNPCNCYFKDSCGCICSKPLSYSEFQILPQNFRPCPAFTLALRGGQFHSFPSDYFYRVGHVQDFVLDVGNVQFQYLNDPFGEASPYNGVTFDVTAYIRMFGVSVTRRWNWGSLYWLAPTSRNAYCEIEVLDSTVPVIQADFGRICQGVVTMANVRSSGVVTIEDRAFAPFYKLVEVDLSNNRIELMRRSYLPYPANSLESIDLGYNNIRTLPDDMFYQMPILQNINLRGNPIATLNERTFSPIFRTVLIEGLNTFPLACDCNSRWLKESSSLRGPNSYSLAEAVCDQPTDARGRSLLNDTDFDQLGC